MKQFIETITDELTGLPIAGAEVFVYDDDNNFATLYAPDGTTEIDNPLTTNEDGEYSFHAPTTEFTALVYYGKRLRRRLRLLVGGGYSAAAAASAASAEAFTGPTYDNTADGLAGTSLGESFAVYSGGITTVYRHDAGPVATAIRKTLSPDELASSTGWELVGAGDTNIATISRVTPLQYGAVGDGVTDDTEAFQAAFDALGSTGELFIPPLPYLITDTLEIQPSIEWAGVHLYGAGPKSKLIWQGGSNKPVIHIRGDGAVGLGFNAKPLIENFQIYGNSFVGYDIGGPNEIPADDYTGVVGIQIGDTPENAFSGVCNVTVRNMLIRNIGTGILGYYESDQASVTGNMVKLFSDYAIRNQHGGSGWWIFENHITDGAENATCIRSSLVSCVIEANILQGVGVSIGIQIDGGNFEGRAVSIRNNYLESQVSADYGIVLYGVDTGIIENNSFQGFAGAKLIALADVDAMSCRNITIGPNRHSQSGGFIDELATSTSGSTNCQITGKQYTNGAVTTISGTWTFKNFDGVAEVSQGVKFPATQNPSSNPNTLDDYEEGTATIGIKFGSTSQTTSSQAGYTKVGRLVTVSGYVAMGAAVSGTGDAYLTGLPFTSGGATAGGISVINLSLANVSFTGQYSGYIVNGTTELALLKTAEAGSRTALTHANFASNSEVEFTLTYAVA